MEKFEKIVDASNREPCFLMGSEYHNDPAYKIRCLVKHIKSQGETIKKLILEKKDKEKEEQKMVWLDINDGKFSNSWNEGDYPFISTERLITDAPDGAKLIKYKCINDEKFEFFNYMKLK